MAFYPRWVLARWAEEKAQKAFGERRLTASFYV
jgi:hypothetical protein